MERHAAVSCLVTKWRPSESFYYSYTYLIHIVDNLLRDRCARIGWVEAIMHVCIWYHNNRSGTLVYDKCHWVISRSQNQKCPGRDNVEAPSRDRRNMYIGMYTTMYAAYLLTPPRCSWKLGLHIWMSSAWNFQSVFFATTRAGIT